MAIITKYATIKFLIIYHKFTKKHLTQRNIGKNDF